MNFLICLKGEFLKAKGTFSFWLVLLGGLLVPLISFLIQLSKPEFFVNRAEDPWRAFIGDVFGTAIPLLFPIFLILLIALSFNLEHKSNAWKKLFVTPYSRTVIYLSKIVFIQIQVVFSLVVFAVAIILFGTLLGTIHPELNFIGTSVNCTFLIKSLIKAYIAYLALIGFQIILSFYFKNFIVPIGVGVFGFIFGIMLIKWEYAAYNFLSNNFHVNQHVGKGVVLDFTGNIATYQLFSIIYFVTFIVIGWVLFNRKAL
jgi:hypothetical protein